jgi:hypothetical protein
MVYKIFSTKNDYMPDDRTSRDRQDSGSETSINWEDNDTVLDFTLRNPSHYGAAHLQCITIDYLNTQPGSLNALTYERDPKEDNPYHGNIVFRQGLSNPAKRMIAGFLALASTLHVKEVGN